MDTCVVYEAVRYQLHQSRHQQQQAGLPLWTQEQWHEAFCALFTGPHSKPGHAHDDLLFFVHTAEAAAKEQQPFTLRRRTAQLAPEFGLSGASFPQIAWDKTLVLNMVLQATYQLTVIACRQESLPQVAGGHTDAPGVTAVTEQVFASPMHTQVNLNASKNHNLPTPSYPDISFTINDFESTFGDVALTQPEDCYCVLLHAVLNKHQEQAPTPEPTVASGLGDNGSSSHAHVGSSSTNNSHGNLPSTSASAETAAGSSSSQQGSDAARHAFPSASAASTHPAAAASAVQPSCGAGGPGGSSTVRLVLFSGYVVHHQISAYVASLRRQAHATPGAVLGRLFQRGVLNHRSVSKGAHTQHQELHKVMMAGPGGLGTAEVAVAVVPAAPAEGSAQQSGTQQQQQQQQQGDSQHRAGLNLLQQGLQAALSVLRPHHNHHHSGDTAGGRPAAPPVLQCALITVSLPVDVLAQNILEAM